MTRNRELNCEDIFECEHDPEFPVSDNGEIVYWRCRCGAVQTYANPGNGDVEERKVAE